MIKVNFKLKCEDCDHVGWVNIGPVEDPNKSLNTIWPIIECPDCFGKERRIVEVRRRDNKSASACNPIR